MATQHTDNRTIRNSVVTNWTSKRKMDDMDLRTIWLLAKATCEKQDRNRSSKNMY